MISIQEAFQLIKKTVQSTRKIQRISLVEAVGKVVAEPLTSPIHMPPFAQSAMDGYALKVHKNLAYKVIGEVQAGSGDNPAIQPGEAVRIFTGAAVPDDADTIVIQERVSRDNENITLHDVPKMEDHIRKTGEQIQKGEVAIEKGTKVTPAVIGFLQGLGISEITVYNKPSIAVITTGDELQPSGQKLARGQIYESNALMLQSALHEIGYKQTELFKVKDTLEDTRAVLHKALEEHAVLLITGGISVGDYDYVKKAMELEGIDEIFYKVKQKPGKPLFFGTKDEKLIFALPGNPAAALSCFYVHVHQALEWYSGNETFQVQKFKATNKYAYVKKGDRPQFLKAFVAKGEVTILGSQSSAMLRSFSVTNCLAYLPEEVWEVKAGEDIEIILLPNS